MFENLLSTQGLSLDRLRSFLAFADARTIVRAAGGDAVRQSLISRQIRELEQFFGVELVRRQGRGLVLTSAGHTLAVIAREQFAALGEFARAAQELPANLDLVAPNSIAIWLIMPALAAIRRRLPHHQFELHHDDTAGIIRSVLEGSHDIGFMRDAPLPRSLGRKAIGSANFAVFVPRSLARGITAHPSSWLRLPMALPLGGALRESLNKLAEKEGITLSPVVGCDSYVQAAAAVEAGALASVLPVIAASSLAEKKVQVIRAPELAAHRHRTLMIWSKRAAATRASVQSAVEALPEVLKAE